MTILIVPTFILIFVALIMLMQKIRRRYVSVKITHWLLMGYTGLLILATAIAPSMITDLPKRATASAGVDQEIYRHLSNGEIESIDPEFLVLKKTFDYENSSLTISSNRVEGNLIYVERKEENDGKIEGYFYNNGLNINGYYFSDKLTPIDFKLENDTLTIQHPNKQNIKLALVQKEFTIKQFNGQKRNSVTTGPDIEGIFLRVPKNIEISNKYSNLIFVGE
jgi:hypothetical protein